MPTPTLSFRARAFVALLPLLWCGASNALAQESHLGAAASVSTLGYLLEAATPVAPKFNVRGGVYLFNLSHDFETDGITMASKLQHRSVMAYLDWFPFGGGFHVSPGVMLYNGIKFDAVARVPAGDRFNLGDESGLISDPTAAVTGDAKISFGKVAPAFAVGWGNLIPNGERRWAIPVNLGFVWARPPVATLNLAGRACAAAGTNCRDIATDPRLRAELQKEQDTFNDDLSVLRILPAVSVGLSYKF